MNFEKGNLSLVLPLSVLAGDSKTMVIALAIKPSSATAGHGNTSVVLPSSAIPDNGKTNLVIPFGVLPGSAHLLYFVQHGSGGLLRLS